MGIMFSCLQNVCLHIALQRSVEHGACFRARFVEFPSHITDTDWQMECMWSTARFENPLYGGEFSANTTRTAKTCKMFQWTSGKL